MANKKTREVWAGPGVLSMGRRTIVVGKPIPKELESKARESLRKKGMIVDEVIKTEKETSDLKDAADAAREAADEAKKLAISAQKKIDEMASEVEKAKKAISTAKGLHTKANKAVKAAGDNVPDDVTAAAVDAGNALAKAEQDLADLTADLPDVKALTDEAVRLRMEADKAAHAAETAE